MKYVQKRNMLKKSSCVEIFLMCKFKNINES